VNTFRVKPTFCTCKVQIIIIQSPLLQVSAVDCHPQRAKPNLKPNKANYIFIHSFIHCVVCLATCPYRLPKRVLHRVRAIASSFDFQHPLLFLWSFSTCLRLYPRVLFTFVLYSIFTSITCVRRPFLRQR